MDLHLIREQDVPIGVESPPVIKMVMCRLLVVSSFPFHTRKRKSRFIFRNTQFNVGDDLGGTQMGYDISCRGDEVDVAECMWMNATCINEVVVQCQGNNESLQLLINHIKMFCNF